jgi:glycosyltransferase involved in cell wall biosynthesis
MIVMLSVGLPPELYGGAEKQCLRLSKVLVASGIPVLIIAGSCSSDVPRHEIEDGVQIVRIRTRHSPDQGGMHLASSIKWTIAVFRLLWRRRREIELVHVHQGKLHVLPALLAQAFFGLPFVVKVGNAEEEFDYVRLSAKTGGYGRIVLRQVVARCRMNIAISSRIASQMRDIGIPSERIRRIPNGIDIQKFTFLPGATLGDPKTFLFLGRLEPEKQPMMLLRCFANAFRGTSGHRLVMAGDGSLIGELKAYVHAQSLGDSVQLLGRVDDVTALLAEAHFFVLASKNEGMSNALLEAMSSGLVPVASAVSGSTDVIQHCKNGFLFGRDSEAELEECLRTAAGMTNADWQIARQAARRTIEDGYVMANIAQVYADLYSSVGRRAER